MEIKICFYASIKGVENEELDLLKYYNNTENGYCIYRIRAGEICSEFIARYFSKVVSLPELLLDKIIIEHYDVNDYNKSKQEMCNGIYKANTDIMFHDSNSDFKFKAFEECKIVREKLLIKYEEIREKLKEVIEKPRVEIYAIMTI